MKYDLDLIIPLYNSGNKDFIYRLRNINLITAMTPYNINIILVEHVVKERETFEENLNILRSDIKHIKLEYDGIFNKGWLNNVGINNSETNNIILGESDCIFDPLYTNDIINFYKENNHLKWFHCWDRIIYINETIEKSSKTLKNTPGGPEGGLIFFDKTFYYEMGGSNEWIECLGGIDDDLVIRASFLTGRKRFKMPGTIYHFWHPTSEMKGGRSSDKFFRKTRMKNVNMCNQLHRNPKLIINFLKSYIGECGGKTPLCNKYPMKKHVYPIVNTTTAYEKRKIAERRNINKTHLPRRSEINEL
jgi:hypothetical protein